jgi:hypothetical protein
MELKTLATANAIQSKIDAHQDLANVALQETNRLRGLLNNLADDTLDAVEAEIDKAVDGLGSAVVKVATTVAKNAPGWVEEAEEKVKELFLKIKNAI